VQSVRIAVAARGRAGVRRLGPYDLYAEYDRDRVKWDEILPGLMRFYRMGLDDVLGLTLPQAKMLLEYMKKANDAALRH
jgi:hypothetical protein